MPPPLSFAFARFVHRPTRSLSSFARVWQFSIIIQDTQNLVFIRVRTVLGSTVKSLANFSSLFWLRLCSTMMFVVIPG